MISLCAFDANDKAVELRYRIANWSDHDVWICDGIEERDKVRPSNFEAYVDRDRRTLVIRKQIEVPRETISPVPRSYRGRYGLVRPGEEQIRTLTLPVPVKRYVMLASAGPDVDYVTRLVLRIGLYDEDLPGRVRSILSLAERLQCAQLTYPEIGTANIDIYDRYFRGLHLSRALGGLAGFSDFWTQGSEQAVIPHDWPALLGDEVCLELAIDGVLISMDSEAH